MLLSDPENSRRHWLWAIGCSAFALAMGCWYLIASLGSARLLGGSSWPGITCGVVAALIILFEALLGLRKVKKVRSWRWLGAAQVWMRAHIWLGLLSVPLILFHSRLFHFGGALTTIVLALFLMVIASGIWGLAMQQFLPKRLLHNVPEETIYSQIPELVEQLCQEAELMILAICGPPEPKTASPTNPPAAAAASVLARNMSAVRFARKGRGLGSLPDLPGVPLPGSKMIWDYFDKAIRPFLQYGTSARTPLQLRLHSHHEANQVFRDWKTRLDQAAYPVIDALEAMCERRRQLDRQARLHFWLHNWLWVHLFLSVVLVFLMIWHALAAVLYW